MIHLCSYEGRLLGYELDYQNGKWGMELKYSMLRLSIYMQICC